MTLKIRIEVPKDGGPYEAKVRIGATEHILAPGDSVEGYVYSVNEVHVTEVAKGTKAALLAAALLGEDFPLGKACDLSGDTACEACQ
jgi:hypothetical protein